MQYKYIPNSTRDVRTLKRYLLFICTSSLTGLLVFAESSSPAPGSGSLQSRQCSVKEQGPRADGPGLNPCSAASVGRSWGTYITTQFRPHLKTQGQGWCPLHRVAWKVKWVAARKHLEPCLGDSKGVSAQKCLWHSRKDMRSLNDNYLMYIFSSNLEA